MKKLLLISVCLAVLFNSSCGKRMLKTTPVNVIPKPASLVLAEGTFELSASTPIHLLDNDSTLLYSTRLLNSIVEKSLGRSLAISNSSTPSEHAINIGVNPSLSPEEYELFIAPGIVTIEGGSPQGVFHAVQTLRQLMPEGVARGERARIIELPAVEIRDKPAFGYRGMMLDVCRHFFNVEEVKQFIDILALHKMNRFHWHLTDDQGWRIEIKQYPKLTEIGSVRAKDRINHQRDSVAIYDEKPYGGYFTQDEVRKIVRYANERFITVIPEIEMPGHALAALASYPELGCKGENYEVTSRYGIMDDAFCAGKEETFTFFENVLSEVIDLFPSEYIHLGGDECRKGLWKECPLCQQRIRDNRLGDEEHLQSYFMQRMERFVNGKGRKIIGWDEILEGGLSPSATVMSWRGSKGGIAAAQKGNHVIMAPNTNCYFDYYQSRNRGDEPQAIGGYVPVEKVYQLDPYAGLEPYERPYILGVQANLWTEYIKTFDHVQYMLLPRLAALSEVGWSYGNEKDFENFKERLTAFRHLYDAAGYNYARHLWTPGSDEPQEVSGW